MPKTKKIIPNLITLTITIIICLLILELLTRIFMYQDPVSYPPINEYDKDLCFKMKPNINVTFRTREFEISMATNAFGFREEKEAFQGKSIMFLGDSFTCGHGVQYNETYVYLAEDMLKEEGYFYSLYNFGVGGYGTMQQRKIAEKYIADIKPEVVMLAFYANDPRDNLENYEMCSYEVDQGGYLVKKGSSKGLIPRIKKFMQLYVNLYRVINTALRGLQVRTPIFDSLAKTADLETPLDYKQYEAEYDEETQEAWNETYNHLNRINDISKRYGARFVIMFIPAKSQLDEDKQERLIQIYNLKNPDFSKINKNLEAYTKENNISFLDLTETFINNGGTEDNYYIIDPHWTLKGNNLAAQTITNYLIENKMV
jgi:hypothetical protein